MASEELARKLQVLESAAEEASASEILVSTEILLLVTFQGYQFSPALACIHTCIEGLIENLFFSSALSTHPLKAHSLY